MKNLNKNNPIGFFDSGVGGLSVLAKFKSYLPNENILYFGDLKNMPYGNKTKEELLLYAGNILDFFKTKEIKAAVIACNTSSAMIYNLIKDKYEFPIFPIIQSTAKIISSMNLKKIGVFATEATVKSNAYYNEISKYDKDIDIIQIACPNWVKFVESNQIDSAVCKKDIMDKLNLLMSYSPQKIILGCTHYPYLLNRLKNILGKDIFIDPAEIFVNYIKTELENLNLINDNIEEAQEQFFVSSSPESFKNNAESFYKLNTLPELINF